MDYKLEEFEFDFQILQRFLQSNILLYSAVLLLVLKIFSVAVFLDLPFNIFFADVTKIALESMANQTRQSMGLGILVEDAKLEQAATLKAEDMVKNQYFSHTSPNGITPWFWFVKAGYDYKYAGENLAIGFYESEEVYKAWLDSPSHKENLLNPNYREIGTAVAKGYGQNNAIVVVQLFGSEKTAVTAPVQNQVQEHKEPAVENAIVKTEGVEPERVLSQSTEAEIQPANKSAASNIFSKIISFMVYDFDRVINDIVRGLAFIVMGLLIILIFSTINFNIGTGLIFRPVLVLTLLALSSFVNKEALNWN